MPPDAFAARRPEAARGLGEGTWADAAEAIRTTDTFPKAVTRSARIGGATVTINGIAKGSGMIAPDMATMLAFVFTDAAIPAPALQAMLAEAADRSLDRTSVVSGKRVSGRVDLGGPSIIKKTQHVSKDTVQYLFQD